MSASNANPGISLQARTTCRIRVLHVIDSLDLGGAQAVLVNLIRHGDKSRFEFEVATMYGQGVYWERLRDLGVPVHSLSFAPHVPLYVPKLVWLCLTRRYNIVHTHLIGANVIAKPLAALCGVPVRINHDHCNDKLADPRRWVPVVDRLTNRLSSHVIAVSQSTREYAVKEEEVPASRVSTIYNGIDLDIYRPQPEKRAAARAALGLPPDAFVVAGIGRLVPQKNFSLFLDVAAAVLARNPRAFFVIAGTGQEERTLRESARRLGIESRLRFLGYVAAMPELYPAIDMLLLTSLYEGLPITILEAMASGTVIVSSRLDGVGEILLDGVDSALVPSGDTAAFTARVCELIDQPSLAARYAQAALEKVHAHYSAQSMARSVEAVYSAYLPGRAGL
jgi:glycosyltransferase involved in cell wall biosynthesis